MVDPPVQAQEDALTDPAHWIAWLRNPDAHVGMADRGLIAELFDRTLARLSALEDELARVHDEVRALNDSWFEIERDADRYAALQNILGILDGSALAGASATPEGETE